MPSSLFDVAYTNRVAVAVDGDLARDYDQPSAAADLSDVRTGPARRADRGDVAA
jgi:hypothetical protein